jgi:hypothetical protein
MHFIDDLFQGRDEFVVPDAQTMIGDPSARRDAGGFLDDQTDLSESGIGIMCEMKIVGESVLRLIHAHRRHHQTIRQGQVLQLISFGQQHSTSTAH